MTIEIHGTCDPRFEGVRAAFADNFARGVDVGASFAATVNGEMVVDLWGGFADPARPGPGRRTPWSTSIRRPRP
jgi:hypothetical protein